MPNRRTFLTSVAASAVVSTPLSQVLNVNGVDADTSAAEKFRLAFAPHPGMFTNLAGGDVLDQIRFAADQGFTAWEQNGLGDESPQRQQQIGDLLEARGMQMGVFVAFADFQKPSFAVRKDEYRLEVLAKIQAAVQIAKRCGAKFFTVVPGTVDGQTKDNWKQWGGGRLADGYQFANVVDLLRECAAFCEPHELVMVLEPLNWRTDHGGVFLERSDQAYAVCKAVNSPSCKILFDIYHQQITEGNLIPNINHCWDEIAYFQIGDNPGRKEPGTGEIHYQNVMKAIHERASREGRNFIFGMEHGNSQRGADGEQKVIDAYRAIDPHWEEN